MPEAIEATFDTPEAQKRRKDPVAIARSNTLQRLWDIDPPNYPLSDQIAQARDYKGLIWLAINVMGDALRAATAQVMSPKARGLIEKALPTTHAQASDEEYVPLRPKSHPVNRLFSRPNPVDPFSMFLVRQCIQWHLHGRIDVWGPKNQAGGPEKLYVLPSALLFPTPVGPAYPRGGWRLTQYYANGSVGTLPSYLNPLGTILPGEEVYSLKNPDPLFYNAAKSPLTACDVQTDMIETIDRSCWAVMNNGIDPSGVLNVPGANEDQCTTITSKLYEKHAGVDQKGRPLVIGTDLESKGVSWNPLYPASKDMGYEEGWNRYVGFVLAIFGLTRGIIGFSTGEGGYSKNWAEIQNWQVRKLQPFCQMIAEFLTHGPIKDWGGEKRGYKLQIDLPKLQDPELLETQLATDAAASAVTVNELRALRGRKPVPGGDVPPAVYEAMMLQKLAPEPVAAPGVKVPPGSAPSGVDRPDNPGARGSLPNRIAKALGKSRVVRGTKAKKALGQMVKAIVGREVITCGCFSAFECSKARRMPSRL